MTKPSITISDRSTSPSQEKTTDKEPKKPEAESLLDREQRSVAALVTRFKSLVDLAATPVQDGATKEVAAANAFQMEVESSALVCPANLDRKIHAHSYPGSRRRGAPSTDSGAQGDVAFWSFKGYWRRRGGG